MTTSDIEATAVLSEDRGEPRGRSGMTSSAGGRQTLLAQTSVVELIMERVRDAIMKRSLEPGNIYSAQQIADLLELGVSRTPVREAMARLANLGMVRLLRNRGLLILGATIEDIQELFQLRLMVEVPATYMAVHRSTDHLALVYRLDKELAAMSQAVKATNRAVSAGAPEGHFETINIDFLQHDTLFHEILISAAGNRHLIDSVRSWRNVITAQRGWKLPHARDLAILYGEHERIADAAGQKDGAKAAEAMYAHLAETGNRVLSELEQELLAEVKDPAVVRRYDRHWFEYAAVPGKSMSGPTGC